MKEIFDISLPLDSKLPLWPGSADFVLENTQHLGKGDTYNNSTLHFNLHTGTHIDAPWHMLEKGATIDALSLDHYIGPAFVVEMKEKRVITRADLEQAEIQPGTRRILFKTRNSLNWTSGKPAFSEDFVALSLDAAQWLVKERVILVGIDGFSIEPFASKSFEIHKLLLSSGVAVLENLNLSAVEAGEYELLALPLKIVGAEASPVRAILRR